MPRYFSKIDVYLLKAGDMGYENLSTEAFSEDEREKGPPSTDYIASHLGGRVFHVYQMEQNAMLTPPQGSCWQIVYSGWVGTLQRSRI